MFWNATNRQQVDYWTDFSKLGKSQTDPDQADRVKPRHGKTVFSRLHLDAIDFFLVQS